MALNEMESSQAQIGLGVAYRGELYFKYLTERERKRGLAQTVTSISTALIAALVSSFGVVVDSDLFFLYVPILAAIVSAVSSVFGGVLNYPARAVRAGGLSKEYSLLQSRWMSIVANPDHFNFDHVHDLSTRQSEIGAPMSSELPFSIRLHRKASSEAHKKVLQIINKNGLSTH